MSSAACMTWGSWDLAWSWLQSCAWASSFRKPSLTEAWVWAPPYPCFWSSLSLCILGAAASPSAPNPAQCLVHSRCFINVGWINTLCINSRTGTGSSLIQVVCDVRKGHSIEHLEFPPFFISSLNSLSSVHLCSLSVPLYPSTPSPISTLLKLPHSNLYSPLHHCPNSSLLYFLNMMHTQFKSKSLYHWTHNDINIKIHCYFMD